MIQYINIHNQPANQPTNQPTNQPLSEMLSKIRDLPVDEFTNSSIPTSPSLDSEVDPCRFFGEKFTDGPMDRCNDVSESWMIAILFVDLVWSSDFKVLLLVLLLLLSLVVVVSKKSRAYQKHECFISVRNRARVLRKFHGWLTGSSVNTNNRTFNGGTPKSSILMGFSMTNHPLSLFGNTHI